ncbi:MAG: hypothetical protein Q8Q20_05985, partial [bacterium]|nr:hypothetical protein [bacterium]
TLYQAFWEGYISQRSVTAEEREYFWPALHFSLLRMILRKLLAESEGRREETYGEMSATQNTDYFRKVFQNSLSNKELIISHIPKA